ncbi:MAG: hypothetical protein ACT4OF_01945 [Caulobacteraceae bacterium]
MNRFVIAAAFLACACTPPAAENAQDTAEPSLPPVTLPVADRAGNRMELLTQSGERWCTADSAWCATTLDDSALSIVHRDGSATTITVTDVAEGDSWELWPQIIRVGRSDDSVLVGVTRSTRQMYSGGGGEASQLALHSVTGGAANEVVRMPLSASATTRACFGEDDEAQRAGACHDEYAFVTRIGLDEGVAEGPPRILLETAAGSYPGRVTRNADSLEASALQPADLVWWRDETCSYRRTYTRGADGLYAPDQPLPACADYLEP